MLNFTHETAAPERLPNKQIVNLKSFIQYAFKS